MINHGTLGIDIGKVIIEAVGTTESSDTSFLGSRLEEALQTPPSPGAIEVIATLTEVFEGRVWLVSKCGPSVQAKTRAWLRHQRFAEQTGVPADNLRFCLERSQKAIHCRQLDITHFIDDRLDVLGHLRGQVPNLYLFGEQKNAPPDWVTPLQDWEHVRAKLAPTWVPRETGEARDP